MTNPSCPYLWHLWGLWGIKDDCWVFMNSQYYVINVINHCDILYLGKMVTGLEDRMLEHSQRVEVILRQGTEGVTASLINEAECFWCFSFLGFSICTASGCLVGFRGWRSLVWWADHDWHGWHESFTTCLNLKICCCCSRSICSRHRWGLTVPASLRSLVLLEIPAILSGMLYSFDYSFDHQETKFTGLPLGCSYQDNL